MAGQKSLTNFLNNDDYLFNLGVHHQAIIDIFQDKNGNIWFSSWNGGGVWRYNPSAARRSDSLKAGEKPFKNYLPSTDYYLQNEDGRSSAKKNLPTYLSNFTNSQSKDNISDDMIFSIAEDKAGNIWFATRRHGACRFDPSAKEKAFTSFGENEGFVSYGIYSILEDKNGHLWFTTEKNGVWSYNPSPNTGGQSFKNYTTKDGLINNSVFSVLEDKIGSLWFGTRGFGLSRYKSSAKLKMGEKAFTNFSE
jgi:ligand-binding sensor domain-containing protein